jgi:glycerol-1-phosphate dehydrogenase [NAD(P)+]
MREIALGGTSVAAMRRTAHDLPQYLRVADSNSAVSETILEVAASHSFSRLMYLFGSAGRGLVGGDLLIDTASTCHVVADHASASSVEEAMRIARAATDDGVDVIVGCGGGRVLDVAKYAAFHANKPFLSVPTQATHDGICSPVAVLQDENGFTRSIGAAPPVGIVVPAHVVERSPRECLVSGIADLASNILAVADWRWARQFAGEEFDDYAALLAETGAQLMLARRRSLHPGSPFTREDVELLVRGLVLSGLAMILAGTSRPCSGSEHLLSHAFDEIGAGHGTHGEQVAVGCRLASLFYDDNSEIAAVGELLDAVGAPASPQDIGISKDDASRALQLAPKVRPGRLTRLTRALEVDPAYVEHLADVVWW